MKLLFTTPHYNLMYNEDYNEKDEHDGPYILVNTETGCTEFTTFMYPGALEMCVKFELAIEAYEKELLKKNEGKADETDAEAVARSKVLSILENVKKRNGGGDVDKNAYRELPPDWDE